MNKAIIIGNVGKDPEVRKFDNGGQVVSFSLATTELGIILPDPSDHLWDQFYEKYKDSL